MKSFIRSPPIIQRVISIFNTNTQLYRKIISRISFSFIKISNLLIYENEVKNGKNFLRSYPSKLNLNVTNICNYRCKFCEIHYFYKYSKNKAGKVYPNHINLDFLKKFNKLMNRSLKIELSGATGEPLMNPFFGSISKKLKKKNITLSMTTNGSLLYKDIANDLIDINFNTLFVSIHSGDSSYYQQLQGGSLSNVIDNLKYMINIKKNKNLKLPKIKVNCLIFMLNYHTIQKLVKLLNDISLKSINIYHYYASRNLIDENASFYFHPNEGNEFLKSLYSFAEGLDIKLMPKEPNFILSSNEKKSEKMKPCYNPWRTLKFKGCVEYENSHYITVCNRILLFRLNHKEFDGDFLRDIWNHEIIRYLRKNVLKNPICKFCRDPFTPKLRCINNEDYQIKRDIAVKEFFKEVYQKVKIKDRKGIYLFNKNPYEYKDYYDVS